MILDHAQITVAFDVAIPAVDTLRGTYWSMVMIEGDVPPPAPSVSRQPTVPVRTVLRYSVQLVTHVGETGSRSVRFANPTALRDTDGTATLDLNVFADGVRGVRPILWVEVFDGDGVLRAKDREERGLLYPGTSLHQRFALGTLPSGRYKAVVFADTGDDVVFAQQYAITF